MRALVLTTGSGGCLRQRRLDRDRHHDRGTRRRDDGGSHDHRGRRADDHRGGHHDRGGAHHQREPEVLTIEVVDEKPVGGVAKLKVKKGDQIHFIVDSDSKQEVHLHGYDIAKDAAPARRRSSI